MSNYTLANAFKCEGLQSSAKFVLVALADCHNGKTGDCFPSIDRLAKMTGLSSRQVQRNIATLKKAGLISVERQRHGRQWAQNFYSFHFEGQTTPVSCEQTTSATKADDAHVVLTGKEPERKPEKKLKRAAPSACASGLRAKPPKTEAELLGRYSAKRCAEDFEKTGLSFYMNCGRLHTELRHFHKRNAKPLSHSQIGELREWFSALPTTGCEVMSFAMANWYRLLDELPAYERSKFGKRSQPRISALNKYGTKRLLDAMRKRQQRSALSLVAANTAPEPEFEFIGLQSTG